MAEWQYVDDTKINAKPQTSEWSYVQEHEEEPYWKSLTSAVPRIVEDISSAARQGIQNLPEYWKKAKPEILKSTVPFYNSGQNPADQAQQSMQRAAQSGAGLAEGAVGLANLPRGVADYVQNRLHLIPQGTAEYVPEAGDQTENINKLFGAPKTEGDEFARGLARNTLNAIPAVKGISSVASKVKAPSLKIPDFLSSKKSIKNQLLETHDLLENKATSGFEHVMDEVYNRGINKVKTYSPEDVVMHRGAYNEAAQDLVPSQPSLPGNPNLAQIEGATTKQLPSPKNALSSLAEPEFISGAETKAPAGKTGNIYEVMEQELKGTLGSEFFDQLKDYFPKTRASNELLRKAKSGDYKALRKLQTDLYTRAKAKSRSSLTAERDIAEEMLEKREDINQAISNHLKKTGNEDLDEVLTQARNDYKNLMGTYYNKHIPNSLTKLFDKQVRREPKNLLSVLAEKSIPMNQLLESHPGLAKKLLAENKRQKVAKGAKKVAKYVIPGTIGGAGATTAIDYLTNK